MSGFRPNPNANKGGAVPQKSSLGLGAVEALLYSRDISSNPRSESLVKYIVGCPKEMKEELGGGADFVARTTGILFVRITQHRLDPNGIIGRMHGMAKMFRLRVLLLYFDESDVDNSSSRALEEINKQCFLIGYTLIVAWSMPEAAKYCEYFFHYDNKANRTSGEKSITLRYSNDKATRVSEIISKIPTVNSTDSRTLMENFGNLKSVFTASEEHLLCCNGIGQKKAQRLMAAFQEPFKKQGEKGGRVVDMTAGTKV